MTAIAASPTRLPDAASQPPVERAPGATFEPLIVGFTCNWCSYRAADLAGTARSSTRRTSA